MNEQSKSCTEFCRRIANRNSKWVAPNVLVRTVPTATKGEAWQMGVKAIGIWVASRLPSAN
jgi:hypothetical protein